MSDLKSIIESAWDNRDNITPDTVASDIKDAILDGEIKNDRKEAYQYLLKKAADMQLTPINKLS